MDSGTIFLLIIGLVVATVLVLRAHLRRVAIVRFCQEHGWKHVPQALYVAQWWRGEPFVGITGKTRDAIIGKHRDRQFVAFEYRSKTGSGESSTTMYFTVWRMQLRAPAPEFSVGSAGLFGGAFGMDRIKIGNDAFDKRFKVECQDTTFAQRVLQPPMVEILSSTGPWEWRLTGDSMLSWTYGKLKPAEIVPRLDRMSAVLEQIPDL